METFAKELAGRLAVHQQRHVVTVFLPVFNGNLDTRVSGDRRNMNRRVCGTAESAVQDDGVLDRFPREHLVRCEFFQNQLDRALARFVGHLQALSVSGRNRRAAGQ